MKIIKYTLQDHTVRLPALRMVCPRCEGDGYILSEHAYSQEEFNEAFHDEEERAQYFKRGGIYDISCPECGGRNVVDSIDWEWLVVQTKKSKVALLARIEADRDATMQYEAECRMERLMGC